MMTALFRALLPKTKISQLSRSDIRILAQIFRIDSSERTADVGQIHYRVSRLPRHLRNSKLGNLLAEPRYTASLCSKHQGMNPQIVWRLLNALQRQVMEGHFNMKRHVRTMNPDEAFTLHRIHAIEGMWTLPVEPQPSPISPWWHSQSNRCEACMLSRVGSNAGALRDLRTIMLSRALNEANAASPRLLRPMCSVLLHFLEELIMLTNRRDEIFYQSGQRSCAMKEAVRQSLQKKKQPRAHGAGGHPDSIGSGYSSRDHSVYALSRLRSTSPQKLARPMLSRETYSILDTYLEFPTHGPSSSPIPHTAPVNNTSPSKGRRNALKMAPAFNTDDADTDGRDLESDPDPLHLSSSTSTTLSQARTFESLTDEYRSLVTLPTTCYDGSPVMAPRRPSSPAEMSWSELYTAANHPRLPTRQVPSGKAVINHV